MSIYASDLANKKKNKKKTSSVIIAFLSGVFVGSVVVSLVVVNYYAGSSISQSKLILEQQQHYQHQHQQRHQHQNQQRRQQQQQQNKQQQPQHQQLRNERSPTSTTVRKGDEEDIPAITFNIISNNNTFDGGIENIVLKNHHRNQNKASFLRLHFWSRNHHHFLNWHVKLVPIRSRELRIYHHV